MELLVKVAVPLVESRIGPMPRRLVVPMEGKTWAVAAPGGREGTVPVWVLTMVLLLAALTWIGLVEGWTLSRP